MNIGVLVEEEGFISHEFTFCYTLEYQEREQPIEENISSFLLCISDPQVSSHHIRASKNPVFINSAACENVCFNHVTLITL